MGYELASPGGLQHAARQFLSGTQKQPKNVCVAWRLRIARQAVSGKFQETQILIEQMEVHA